MLWQILLFEIKYRLTRPDIYLYFLSLFLISFFHLGFGILPVAENEFLNSPAILAIVISAMTMLMMVVSSAIMGVSIYREIEYGTKEYYFSYPITKADYFLGRYLGSFFIVLLIGSAILWGAYFGSSLSPLLGWQETEQYGPNNATNYIWSFLIIGVPNLFLSSSLFFGLVAITRNVKVIYSSGIILFLGYVIASLYFTKLSSIEIIYLVDPFVLNSLRLEKALASTDKLNQSFLSVNGLFLVNRFIWTSVGSIVLVVTYHKFNFEKFILGRNDKKELDRNAVLVKRKQAKPQICKKFGWNYDVRSLLSLTKIELLNILRDNFFWIIIFCCVVFLYLFIHNSPNHHNLVEFPRTTLVLFNIFNYEWSFFVFFIIVFYTGEAIHRDHEIGFSTINDSMPTSNWVFLGSKFLSLSCLAIFLAILPVIISISIQILKGYYQLDLSTYLSTLILNPGPRYIEMVMLCFALHILIDHKFLAHGIGIVIWVLMYGLQVTGYFDFNLLLYSFSPPFVISDMNGLSLSTEPTFWFNVYWLCFGGLLLTVAYLFFKRGSFFSFRDRLQMAKDQFGRAVRLVVSVFLLFYFSSGIYIYYNVCYLNSYFTQAELLEKKAVYEKALKRYERLPLPKITSIKLLVDLFPKQRKAKVKGSLTLVNKSDQPIERLLFNGDDLLEYSIKYQGKRVPFKTPVDHKKGMFNWRKQRQEDSPYRIYHLDKALMPGDTVTVEVSSMVGQTGFTNRLGDYRVIYNGTVFEGGLPSMGYHSSKEILSKNDRKKFNLSSETKNLDLESNPKPLESILNSNSADLVSLDITISTSEDQIAIAPGTLAKKWKEKNRIFYNYVCNQPGIYLPFAVFSANYSTLFDSVMVVGEQNVDIEVYYHPSHQTNLAWLLSLYKTGLIQYSEMFGPYPFEKIRLVETDIYGPFMVSYPGVNSIPEYYAWNTDLTDSVRSQYCYFVLAKQIAQQWWGKEIVPNNTSSSNVISRGLAKYSALVLIEKQYGLDSMIKILRQELNSYLRNRSNRGQGFGGKKEDHKLIDAVHSYEWDTKAGLVLYGLRGLIGEETLNKALVEFKSSYSFSDRPPFAGTKDLFGYLKSYVPDTLQYFLTDTWEKVSFYNNKIIDVSAVPTGFSDEHELYINLKIDKLYIEDGVKKHEKQINDYIDIGVFSYDSGKKKDLSKAHKIRIDRLYMQQFGAGEQIVKIVVNGKPVRVSIDPYLKLMDIDPNDNSANIAY